MSLILHCLSYQIHRKLQHEYLHAAITKVSREHCISAKREIQCSNLTPEGRFVKRFLKDWGLLKMRIFSGKETLMKILIVMIFLSCWSTALTASERPNILLLMAEDLSPRVGSYGDKVAFTPNIDKLAQEGVRYTNSFTTAGVCAPSRAAIISGMYQESIGAQHMRSHNYAKSKYFAVPPEEMKAFPELLRAEGYFTFNTFKLDYQFSGISSGSGPFTIWDADKRGIIEFDELPSDQPFFGYLTFLGTHESAIFPRDVFPRSIPHLLGQLMQIPLHWNTEDQIKPGDVDVPPYYPDTPIVRKDIARHYNNLITVDQQIGDVLSKLEKAGLAENTIVIWTTDHGDGLPRAKRELYDSGIHVPMIIRWPEKYRPSHIEPGSTDKRMVSLVDLAPTILSLAGASLPAYLQGMPFAGDSPTLEREYVFAARDRIGKFPDKQRAVRDNRYKYILSDNLQAGGFHLAYRDDLDIMKELWRLHDAGKLNDVQKQWFLKRPAEMLFDTLSDPHEIHNLVDDPDHIAELSRLRAAYHQHREQVPDLSDEHETDMAARFWPDGIEPATDSPSFKLIDDMLVLSHATKGASLGYRLNDSDWHLYIAPIELNSGDFIQAKAVRYGWAESESIELTMD
ncbi:MAG: N-sulfoglucosamine sulfohydrolase [Flavobacterium sp.]|jgi:N-sulfoglucosamine sulfohydrolase